MPRKLTTKKLPRSKPTKSAPAKSGASKAVPTKSPKLLKARRAYSVRDLPLKTKKGSFALRLKEIESRADELDKLKKPNEYWAAKFFGARTYQVYENIDLLVNTLNRYEAVIQNGAATGKKLQQLIDNVKFIRFDGTSKEWTKGKNQEVAEREAKEKKLRKEVSTEKKKAKKAHRKLSKVTKEKDKEIKSLKKALAEAKKKLKQAEKKPVVKRAKKQAKKQTVKKQTKKQVVTKKRKRK